LLLLIKNYIADEYTKVAIELIPENEPVQVGKVKLTRIFIKACKLKPYIIDIIILILVKFVAQIW